MRNAIVLGCCLVIGLLGCKPSNAGDPFAAASSGKTLLEAREGFGSNIEPPRGRKTPPPKPTRYFELVQYESPVGNLWAYLTPDPQDGKKHPAIIWITGGDCNTIGDVWSRAPRSNDQTARAFREAGVVMMFPSLRGGNDNPGKREGFFGEVEDIIYAGEALSTLPYVDPQRIYLGGHSTGGTMVLLVAASTEQFRAVFSFGPVHDVQYYPKDFLPFSTANPKELELRAPERWLHAIKTPTFVIEGSGGNAADLARMRQRNSNPLVHFYEIPGKDHFQVLAPVNDVLARKVVDDSDLSTPITIAEAELQRAR